MSDRFNEVLDCVEDFKGAMIYKLRQNQAKGNRDGWKQEDAATLIARCAEELGELAKACRTRGAKTKTAISVREEAADVANFAMMIADLFGGLYPECANGAEENPNG